MIRLIFIRHGEPDYENDCLTADGKKQARSTAQRLKNEKLTALYCSPMGRAVQTASYTAAMYGMDVRVLDFMREISWGDTGGPEGVLEYGGHPWTLGYKLLTERPDMVGSADWDKHPYFRDNTCTECYKEVSERFDMFLEGFGLVRRDGLYYCRESCDENIALFAHGGSGAVVFSHVFNMPFPFVLTSMPFGVCSVSVVEFDARAGEKAVPRLRLFNDMGHIANFKDEKLHFEQ